MTFSALGVAAVYAGSGSTGPFSLVDSGANPILFLNNSEIVVNLYASGDDSHPSTLTLTTDYSLTGAGLSTPGSVTLVSPLAVGQTLVIRRVTPATQTLDLIFGGDLSLDQLEATLDRIVRQVQEVKYTADRALRFSATHPSLVGSETRTVPTPVAGNVLAWNSTADRLVNAAGHLLLSGSGAPSNSLGGDGDFYLDTTGNRLYGPKAGGVWSTSVSIVGPQGIQGIQGPPGPSGAPGSGSGDVVGPSGAVADNVVSFNATTGKIIKDSGVSIASITSVIASAYRIGSTTKVALADGGTGANLVDPNVDRILFWDDSANSTAFLAPGTGLSISGTTINFGLLGLEALVDPNIDKLLFWDDSANALAYGALSTGITTSGTTISLTTNAMAVGVPFIIDGGGATITTGVKGYVPVPFDAVITQWDLLADQSGSIVVNVWKDTYANYPPTVADKITASAPPTITTALKNQDTTLSGWTTAISKGDILAFNVDSVTNVLRATLMLYMRKT